MWKFRTKLTEEDIKIQDLVKSFLSKPDTLIEIDPSDMSYILSYEPMGYYIMVDSVGIKISNHNFAKDIRLSDTNKLDLVKDLIKEEATKRRNEKKKKIFKNNIDLLDKITINITFDGNEKADIE